MFIKEKLWTNVRFKHTSICKANLRCYIRCVCFPQVQDEEIQSESGNDQEPWIGVVPVEMDDSKGSTGNQESFTDAMVNKVRRSIQLESGVNAVQSGMFSLQKHPLCSR